mgnify:FL=1
MIPPRPDLGNLADLLTGASVRKAQNLPKAARKTRKAPQTPEERRAAKSAYYRAFYARNREKENARVEAFRLVPRLKDQLRRARLRLQAWQGKIAELERRIAAEEAKK